MRTIAAVLSTSGARRLAAATGALALAVGGLAGGGLASKVDPTASADRSVRFTASGDIAAISSSSATLTRVGQIAPDFHLAVGDLSYGTTGQEQTWCDFVRARVGQKLPFELIAGNHESNGQNGNINDFSACLPNQLPGVVGTYGRRWYVDVPQKDPLVRVVNISPGINYGAGALTYARGTADYQWTSGAIDDARASGVPWVVVGTHMPCLSIGIYSCAAGADITNLLLEKKVDLVLNGHEHMYQRTHQLALAGGCTAISPGTYDARCVADSDGEMRAGAGTVIATVGTGGQGLRDANTADPEAPYFARWNAANADGTYGNLLVGVTPEKLTASFDRAAGGTFTDSFTLDRTAAPPQNQDPSASFTSTCTALACSFDGRGSSDPDGTIASYAWDLGDGTTDAGPAVSRTYAAAGTYTVRVTVTDDDGATATTTRTVTVAPAETAVARDGFGRTVTGGLGSAEVGGPWTVLGTASRYSVDGSAALLRHTAAGTTVEAGLGQVSAQDTDVALTLSTDKTPTGSGLYTDVVTRRSSAGAYKVTAVVSSSGSLGLRIVRRVGTTDTVVAGTAATGVTLAPGERVRLRVRVTGNGTSTVQARAWKVGAAEPTTWQRSFTDTTAALQSPGAVAISSYLSSGSANAPVTLSVDDVLVTRP